MPLTQLPLLSGGRAGFSKDVPIIDTTRVGLVEWAAYGSDLTTPLLRSGCLDSAGQQALNWGNPIISERATVVPPPAGAVLATLPGDPGYRPLCGRAHHHGAGRHNIHHECADRQSNCAGSGPGGC